MRPMLSALLAIGTLALGSTAAQNKATDHPYYPLKVGDQWTYRSGKETVVIQVEKQTPVEFMQAEGKAQKLVGYVLKSASGPNEGIEEVAVLPDGVYRVSRAGKPIKPPLRFVKLPLNPGDSWKVDSKTEDGKRIHGQFVAGTETIIVPLAGKQLELKTITVTSKDLLIDDQDLKLQYWFAERIGMVKEQVRIGKHDQTLELRAFKLVR